MSDISDLNDKNLIGVDIFFVDINGVGKKLNCKNGIELAQLLRKTFKKAVFCVYSSSFNPSLDGSLDGLYTLKKEPNSTPFFEKIDELISILNK